MIVNQEESQQIKISKYDLTIAGISMAAGAAGGIGHHQYNQAYNSNGIQGTFTADVICGMIAGYILSAAFGWKYKKALTLKMLVAFGMAGGLAFPSIIGATKNIVAAQVKIQKLETAVVQEQQQAIANNKRIAETTNDPRIKKQAIENIGQVGARSEAKDESIEAIKDIAKTNNAETKQKAIAELSTIVDETEDSETIKTATKAIADTTKEAPESLILDTLVELRELIVNAETEEKREKLIEQLASYHGKHGNAVDNWVVGKLSALHTKGLNDYLVFNAVQNKFIVP